MTLINKNLVKKCYIVKVYIYYETSNTKNYLYNPNVLFNDLFLRYW